MSPGFPFLMWLWELIKLHIWLLSVAQILFLLDGAGLESEGVDKAWAFESTALHSNPNSVTTSFVDKGKWFNLYNPQMSHMWDGDKNGFHSIVVRIMWDQVNRMPSRSLLPGRNLVNVCLQPPS